MRKATETDVNQSLTHTYEVKFTRYSPRERDYWWVVRDDGKLVTCWTKREDAVTEAARCQRVGELDYVRL